LDNPGKDIRTLTSGVVGVGDSAEVYEIDRRTSVSISGNTDSYQIAGKIDIIG
jgi:hypothetical protein